MAQLVDLPPSQSHAPSYSVPPPIYEISYAQSLNSLLHTLRGVRPDRLQLALDFLDRQPKRRIVGDPPLNQVEGVDDR